MSDEWAIVEAQIPDERKMDIARRFVALGSLQSTSDEARLPLSLLRYWEKQDWFAKAVAYWRADRDSRIGGRLNVVIENALKAVEDRLEGGDYKLDRFGNLVRVPVSAKDSAVIAGIALQHRKAIESDKPPESMALQSLAEKMDAIGKKLGVKQAVTLEAAP